MSDLSSNLKRLRLQAGLSVSQVAEQIGTARSTVYAWESREYGQPPSPAHLKAILDLYMPPEPERLGLWEQLGSVQQSRKGTVEATPVVVG